MSSNKNKNYTVTDSEIEDTLNVNISVNQKVKRIAISINGKVITLDNRGCIVEVESSEKNHNMKSFFSFIYNNSIETPNLYEISQITGLTPVALDQKRALLKQSINQSLLDNGININKISSDSLK